MLGGMVVVVTMLSGLCLGDRELLRPSDAGLPVTSKDYLRKDWCNTEPLVQSLVVPGCTTKTLLNRFCYGQCNSFFVPRNPFSQPKQGEAFISCGSCRPKKVSWMTVTLNCPGLDPPIRRKKILRVKQCKCMAIN